MQSADGLYTGFEDGSFSGWEPIEFPERARDRDGNDWRVTDDAIEGEYSLEVTTAGDNHDNGIATVDRVVDMSQDFELSFRWRTPDPDNRGIEVGLLDKQGTNFEERELDEITPDDGLRFSFGPDAISTSGNPYSGNPIQFCGRAGPETDLSTDTTYQVTIRKEGSTATLRFRGEEVMTVDGRRTTGQYRLRFHTSGTYGNRSTMVLDEIRIRPLTSSDDFEAESPSGTYEEGFESYTVGELPPGYELKARGGGTTAVLSESEIEPSVKRGQQVLAVSWNGDGGRDTRLVGPINPETREAYTPTELDFWLYDTRSRDYDLFQIAFRDGDGDRVFNFFGTDSDDEIVVNGTPVTRRYWSRGWHHIRVVDIDWERGTASVDIDDGEITGDITFEGSEIQQLYVRPRGFDEGDLLVDDINLVGIDSSKTDDTGGTESGEQDSGSSQESPTADPEDRLGDATRLETVEVENEQYHVYHEIPDEPDDRLAFTDAEGNLLEPERGVDVAITYTYGDSYNIDSSRRLTYTIEQYQQFEQLEQIARAADLLAELSAAVALAKIDRKAAITEMVSAVRSVVEWGVDSYADPYEEYYTKMATTSRTVDWADEAIPDPSGSLLSVPGEVLGVGETMLEAASVVDTAQDLTQAASAVREVISAADSIDDSVDAGTDLRSASYTALTGLGVELAAGSVTEVAESQTKQAALGAGSAAARRPLLTEIIALETMAREFRLAPAGIYRLHALRQTDYQLEAAAWYGMSKLQRDLSESPLGPGYDALLNTDQTAESFRENAASWADVSQLTLASSGREFQRGLDRYNTSLNAVEYGQQSTFDRS